MERIQWKNINKFLQLKLLLFTIQYFFSKISFEHQSKINSVAKKKLFVVINAWLKLPQKQVLNM